MSIYVRCPHTNQLFEYDSEESIPPHQVFKRVYKYRILAGKSGYSTVVYAENLKQAKRIVQSTWPKDVPFEPHVEQV